MNEIVAHVAELLPTYIDQATDRIISYQRPTYLPLSRDQIVQRIMKPGFEAFLRDLQQGTATVFADYFGKVGMARAEQNGLIDDILLALQVATDVMGEDLKAAFDGNIPALQWWFERMHQIIYAGARSVARSFVAGREQIIQRQASYISETAAPIVPIYTGILVLPLVGSIDQYRAGQILEALLTAIADQQADQVIVDITGIDTVDTAVANYLLQTARAARLLGSEVILVGIGALIAQTLVHLDLELTGIVTRANLQSGIEYALAQHNLAIGPRT